MLAAQGGACAICKVAPAPGSHLHVDHCHARNMVRGLLCQQCNIGLGAFKDTIASFRSAVSYLRYYGHLE